MPASVRQWAQAALDVCYPRRCEGCGASSGGFPGHLCWDCLGTAAWIHDPMCARCGDPVDGMVEHQFECGWCRRTHPAFDRARSVIRFRGPLRQALHRFKYQHARHIAPDFGGILAAGVHTWYPGVLFDAVTPVPLHPVRERARHYNQARLLAADLSRRLRIPLVPHALARVRMTPTQTRLSADERKRNVRNAFASLIPDWIAGRRWLLVDDVMTTGATVDACARVLKTHGASRVHVITLARG